MNNDLKYILNDLSEIIYKDSAKDEKESKSNSDLLRLLDEYARMDITSKFKKSDIVMQNSENDILNIQVKADIINSIILLFLEKPRLKKLIEENKNDSEKTKNIINKLHRIAYDLYKNHNSSLKNSRQLLNIHSFILASLNGILSDSICEVDSYIAENRDILLNLLPNDKSIKSLEYKIYFLILYLSKRFENLTSINVFDALVQECEDLLAEIQTNELKKENFNIANGFHIGALANILYVLKLVKEYLFSGSNGISNDINTEIDSYCYNAINLLNETNYVELKQIAILLRYALKQVCSNSLWGVYGKNPLVNKFISKCFKANENLIYSLLPSQRKAIIEKKLLTCPDPV